MKKFTTILVAICFAVLSIGAAGANTNGFLAGAEVPLEVGSEFGAYVGYAGETNDYIFTLAKDSLSSWAGVYSIGIYREWRFTNPLNVRAGFKLGLDCQPEGPTFDGAELVGGLVFTPLPFVGVGAFMTYDGDVFLPKISFEIYPSKFEVGAE